MRADAVLLDIDGVLLFDGRPIPGARETLRFLEEKGIPYRLLTNATRLSRRVIAERLASAGMDAGESRVHTALVAAAALLRERRWSALYLVDPEGREDLPPEGEEGKAEAVFVGDCGNRFTYEALNRVFRELLRGAALLAGHKNPYWVREGRPAMDGGAFVAALEYASGVEAELVGKPRAPFFHAALEGLLPPGADRRRAVMVGDRWNSDVEGARAAGLSGVLVRTGLYREGDEHRGAPEETLDSVADLPEWLLG